MMDKKKGMVWIASYPRSGNTWTRLFIAHLFSKTQANPNAFSPLTFNSHLNRKAYLDQLVGFDIMSLSLSEWNALKPEIYIREHSRQTNINFYKIHRGYTYRENGEPVIPIETMFGVIYLIRNPLDIAVSLAAFFQTSIDNTIEFMSDISNTHPWILPCMYENFSSWSFNVLSWVDAKDIDCLVLRYEDMKLSPYDSFLKLADFLQVKKSTDELLHIIESISFETLQQCESQYGFPEAASIIKFFRKGIIGEWKNALNDDQIEKIIADHGVMMKRFGYLDEYNQPVDFE